MSNSWDTKKDRLLKELVKEAINKKIRRVNFMEFGKKLGYERFDIEVIIGLLEKEGHVSDVDKRSGDCKMTSKGIYEGS